VSCFSIYVIIVGGGCCGSSDECSSNKFK